MKLCKDCRWVQRHPVVSFILGGAYDQCLHPTVSGAAGVKDDSLYVTGKPSRFRTVDLTYCGVSRSYRNGDHNCAPEARYWEPKHLQHRGVE